MSKKNIEMAKELRDLDLKEPSTISASPPQDSEPNKSESLTPDELQNILRAKARSVQLMGQAEKAVSDARIAELELQNIILLTYNKYQLNQNAGDSITENGLIHRARKNGENNGQ
jgi:hypothetical protein